jgi:aspartyl/asparaginyl beta-hydroxylase (cupin superfamily)
LGPERQAEALLTEARALLRGADAAAALALLQRAAQLSPKDPMIALEAAGACRRLGDRAGEAAALERALAADPYCYPALLLKGALLEEAEDTRSAARVWRNALKILPPAERLPQGLAPLAERARARVREDQDGFDAFLESRIGDLRKTHAGAKLDRFEECKDALLGRKKIYAHEPTLLHFPRLPAIGYFDEEMFPWLSQLEAATDDITAELAGVLESDSAAMRPYVQYAPGMPVNQWAELNHSPKWQAYFLWENGVRDEDHCRRCPNTASLLDRLPLAKTPGFAPTAFFSVLAAGAHIPPHTGSTNVRLVTHLPLIVPEGCLFRVGNETREWRRGKAWVFDDTIEHEGWNRSDKTRIILIFDVWNPFLTDAEKDFVNAFLAAHASWQTGASR